MESILNEDTLLEGVRHLSQYDPDLSKVVKKYGPPPLWIREPGFPMLLKIILEQQVSLASAQATFNKLLNEVGELTPSTFLTFSNIKLKEMGFSRQKSRYCRLLAGKILNGSLDLIELQALSDDEVMEKLTSITGIGPWTAGIYSLMVLRRQDIWPRGDLALRKAMKEVKGLDEVPDNEESAEIAEKWHPWRSIAARILWHHYLSQRSRKDVKQ
jgi:DNA-3-methyladenine glycosylase II